MRSASVFLFVILFLGGCAAPVPEMAAANAIIVTDSTLQMVRVYRYFVDHADYLFAAYDREPRGGRARTVKYAKFKARRLIAIHPDTLHVQVTDNV